MLVKIILGIQAVVSVLLVIASIFTLYALFAHHLEWRKRKQKGDKKQ